MLENAPNSAPVLRILIVDPDAGSAEQAAKRLERQGYGVRMASDRASAFLVISEFRPHVILDELEL